MILHIPCQRVQSAAFTCYCLISNPFFLRVGRQEKPDDQRFEHFCVVLTHKKNKKSLSLICSFPYNLSLPMSSTPLTLKGLLAETLSAKASDLHLSVGAPPEIRIDGALKPIGTEILDAESCKKLCYEALTPEGIKAFEKNQEADLAIPHGPADRFRVNLFIQQGTVAGAFRPIPTKIPAAKDLGIPEVAMRLTNLPRGLVLVTGPTGSGKSTTLASMIDQINRTREEHIITVEDPIEFIHHPQKSLVVQREVGKDTETFGAALKRILRQDPDIVLIGEMRDLETIGTAITVSETGHLVFATLHTNTAAQTINRIIDVFPPSQQPQVRTQLSFILEGILCQTLVPKINGGRALAMEILIPTPAIRNLIREDKIHQLYASMQMDQKRTGMQTLNQSLAALVKAGTISKEEAIGHATDPEEMKKLLGS